MATLPIFGAGNYENILNAIAQKQISYPAWMYCRDQKKLGFVEKDGSFVLMKGDNKEQVAYVDTLPSVSEGDTDVLYVVDTICYKFDGQAFIPLGADHTAELKTLNDRLDAMGTKVDGLEKADETLAGQIEALDKKIDALEIPQECICKPIKYDITDVPAGTIVDYREDEIRIMCPEGTQFVKQAVGAGGDPNCNYFTFKTYAPSDDVVGYREHLGDKFDDATLTDLKTDAYGRRYQPTWLALARCDADDNWTYYGANSTKEHYIGYDYQIDWYNADGVMVASDCVRINLSNEECHSTIEPYYVHGVQTDVDALIAQIKDLEEQVKTLEGNSMTFVELE